MYKYLIKIFRKFHKPKELLNINIKKQKDILDSIGKKNEHYNKFNEVRRSYLQYLCQMKLNNSFYNLFINLISFILIFPITIYFLLKIKKNFIDDSKNIAINLGVQNKLPKSLNDEFKLINGEKNSCLNLEDIKFIFNNLIAKYPFSFYFILKNVFKMSLYRYNINLYPNASAVLVSAEYSFTSSFMTKYCNDIGLKHINYMHGEKLFYIRDSFIKFDRFYIWDKYYRKLFIDLNAYENQFIVELPETFVQKYVNNDSKKIEQDRLTYYLQGIETDNELKVIKKHLDNFNYLEVRVRPHPIYSDTKKIKKIFNNRQIENEKDIYQSLLEAKYIVSKYSTVLYEGYLMDKNIVIDDISSPDFFRLLKEFKYIIFTKNVIKLSDILK